VEMSEDEYRRMVTDAAQGIESINRYVEHRLTLADCLEEDGFIDAAAEMRAVYMDVWTALAGSPQRDTQEELHDISQPVIAG